MQPDDKASILTHLHSSRKALLDVVGDVSEDLAGRVPAPGRWSVLECVEHLAISEQYLFSQISSASRCGEPVIDRLRENSILSRGADRTKRVPSPNVGLPTGQFSTLKEAVEHFLTTRDRTIQFVETCDEDLHAQLTSHPIVGPVNCYETLLLIAVHPHRHAQQIEEIKTALR